MVPFMKYDAVTPITDGNIIRRMRFACWITKATDSDSEYVIIIALRRQKWLCERASVCLNTHVASPLSFY